MLIQIYKNKGTELEVLNKKSYKYIIAFEINAFFLSASLKDIKLWTDAAVLTCNTSDLGGRYQRDCGLKPVLAKRVMSHLSQ
jgi:hypothetical protein